MWQEHGQGQKDCKCTEIKEAPELGKTALLITETCMKCLPDLLSCLDILVFQNKGERKNIILLILVLEELVGRGTQGMTFLLIDFHSFYPRTK